MRDDIVPVDETAGNMLVLVAVVTHLRGIEHRTVAVVGHVEGPGFLLKVELDWTVVKASAARGVVEGANSLAFVLLPLQGLDTSSRALRVLVEAVVPR